MNKVQRNLKDGFKHLKGRLSIGRDHKIAWRPDNSSILYDKIKGDTIFIYKKESKKARETLRHEYLDYAISLAIKPYHEVTNDLIKLVNARAYKRKEKIVHSLSNLLAHDYSDQGEDKNG